MLTVLSIISPRQGRIYRSPYRDDLPEHLFDAPARKERDRPADKR